MKAAGEGSRRGPAACQDQGGGGGSGVRDSSDKSRRRSFSVSLCCDKERRAGRAEVAPVAFHPGQTEALTEGAAGEGAAAVHVTGVSGQTGVWSNACVELRVHLNRFVSASLRRETSPRRCRHHRRRRSLSPRSLSMASFLHEYTCSSLKKEKVSIQLYF